MRRRRRTGGLDGKGNEGRYADPGAYSKSEICEREIEAEKLGRREVTSLGR